MGSKAGYIAVGLGLVVLSIGWYGWRRYRTKVSEVRYRRLTSCQVAGCNTGVPCAVACARQFLQRNGYGDPSMGQKDWMVFDIIDGRNGESADVILASRANAFATAPVDVCRTAEGYEIMFFSPEQSREDLSRKAQITGRMVVMRTDLTAVHLVHTPVIRIRRPGSEDCAFIP
jgi:hypothetical protein